MPLALLIIFIQLHHPFTPYFLPTILSPLVSVRLSDRAHGPSYSLPLYLILFPLFHQPQIGLTLSHPPPPPSLGPMGDRGGRSEQLSPHLALFFLPKG